MRIEDANVDASFLFVSYIFATVFTMKLNGYRIFSDESHVLSIRSRCSSRIMRIIENNVATFEEVCLNSNRQDEMSGKNIAGGRKIACRIVYASVPRVILE